MEIRIIILLICVLLVKPFIFVKVLTTPKFEEGKAPPSSFASIKNYASPALRRISSCFWTSLYFDFGSIWSMSNSYFGTKLEVGSSDNVGNYVRLGRAPVRFELPDDFLFTPEKWFFFCFSLDNDNKELKIYLNSEKIFEKIIDKHLDDFEIAENFLQSEQIGKAPNFAGQIAEINIWSTILNNKEIKELFECEEISKVPDVLNWKAAELVLGPNLTLTEKKDHPCLEKDRVESNLLIYPVKTAMEPKRRPLRVCNALGGIMEPPKDKLELLKLGEKFSQMSQKCPSKNLWVPVFKGKSENEWLDANHQNISYTLWRKGQPNGGEKYEKCVTIEGIGTDEIGYRDTGCTKFSCFYCQIEDYKHFHLKGICPLKGNAIDRKYVLRPTNLMYGRPVWKGFSSSIINWNNSLERWELSDRVSNTVLASLTSDEEFPVGLKVWQLESDNLCVDKPKGQELSLMFSKCKEFEYSCSDGSCIAIESKCNFVPDCWEGEDEKNCAILSTGNLEGYESDLPDININETGHIVKKNVKITIRIKDIESIEEIQSRFTALFVLKVAWFDSRLMWKDLNDDSFLNIPSEEQKQLFWFPKIFVANSENNFELPNDSKAKLIVEKKGGLIMSREDDLAEVAYFNGAENPILYKREFNIKLKCKFHLQYFPFDIQTCSITLQAGNKVRNFIKLRGGSVIFTGNRKLALFEVVHWELDTDAESGDAYLKVNIFLKRQISQYMFGIYLPSLFIMVIAQVTLYFKKEHFKTAIPVAITAMLLMYTLNNTISSKLPQTSDIKFIDVWIIYGLSLHFLILILLVLIEHLPDRANVVFVDNSKSLQAPRISLSAQEATRTFAQKFLPIVEVLFVCSYMICAFIIYNKSLY